MTRADLLQANAAIFKAQGAALDQVASKDVKVCVVGNPANTNALIASHHAPSIPKKNFTAMTRLDFNRAKGMIAAKAGGDTLNDDVENIILWGNHSNTMYPDVNHATIKGQGVREVLKDDAYLDDEFLKSI